MRSNNAPNTIFSDIDGTILEQMDFELMMKAETFEEISALTVPLHSAKKKMNEWYDGGAHIVLTTARPEELREFTEIQMEIADIPYHQLVMGIGWGNRVLINNLPTNGYSNRATSFEVVKNDHYQFNNIEL